MNHIDWLATFAPCNLPKCFTYTVINIVLEIIIYSYPVLKHRFGICWKWVCSALLWISTNFTSWIAILLKTRRRFTGNNQTWWTRRRCGNVVWPPIGSHAKAKPNQRARLNPVDYFAKRQVNTLIFTISWFRFEQRTFKT